LSRISASQVKSIGGINETNIGKVASSGIAMYSVISAVYANDRIEENIKKFYKFAENNPQWKFYVAQDAEKGYNGYEVDEMVKIWSVEHPPDNVYFYEPFYILLKECFPLSILDK
jgi:hypothetical protein